MEGRMSPDFEAWLMRGLVVVLLTVIGYLLIALKNGQDERINKIEAKRDEDKTQFGNALDRIVDNFTSENKETRSEFKAAIEVLTNNLEKNTTALTEMKVALAANYSDFVAADVYRQDQKEIWNSFRECQEAHSCHPK
jgi:uncharacterized membrane-anchored protein YhcB (DUF1043 family)